MARVVLAMSGGVDSSVAADLLIAAGHEVIGVFMRHGEASPVACAAMPDAGDVGDSTAPSGSVELPIVAPRLDHKQGCCTASDAEDARRVADRLGIPFYALNLQQEFRRIIDYFVAEYTVGRTPNPCVMCNNWIKFGKLFDYADSVGAEFVATGHYARLRSTEDPGLPALCRGVDAGKDQSYVLAGIPRHLLRRMLLPVGGFQKSEIRARAGNIGLRVADKKDSQEICFVTSGHHDEFVRAKRRAGDSDIATIETAGEIVTVAGEVVGTHPGIEGFTIGQRRGIGVAMGSPRFVVRIEPDTRRVVIGEKEDLERTTLVAERLNWLVEPPTGPLRCLAQIRYNSAASAATAAPLGDGSGSWQVAFDQPRTGVAPGQAVVFYEEDRVLAGGWIA
jgi:tRNA-specific 2-thiouridylase